MSPVLLKEAEIRSLCSDWCSVSRMLQLLLTSLVVFCLQGSNVRACRGPAHSQESERWRKFHSDNVRQLWCNHAPPRLTLLSVLLPGLETVVKRLLWSEVEAAALPAPPPLPRALRDEGHAPPPSGLL